VGLRRRSPAEAAAGVPGATAQAAAAVAPRVPAPWNLGTDSTTSLRQRVATAPRASMQGHRPSSRRRMVMDHLQRGTRRHIPATGRHLGRLTQDMDRRRLTGRRHRRMGRRRRRMDIHRRAMAPRRRMVTDRRRRMATGLRRRATGRHRLMAMVHHQAMGRRHHTVTAHRRHTHMARRPHIRMGHRLEGSLEESRASTPNMVLASLIALTRVLATAGTSSSTGRRSVTWRLAMM